MDSDGFFFQVTFPKKLSDLIVFSCSVLQFFTFFVPEVIVLKLEFLCTQAQTYTDTEVFGSGSSVTLSSWVG